MQPHDGRHRSRSTTRRSTIYVAARQPADDRRRARRRCTIPTAAGPVRARHARDGRSRPNGPASVTTERRPAQRDRHGDARRPTTCRRRTPTVQTALKDADLPAGATAKLGGVTVEPGGRVLAARPRAARGHPDRLHRHGRDVPLAAPAAAAARLGAVRGDRRDPAADHLGHPARRRLADRRADADRHRGDERDRARRPGQPVPASGHDGAAMRSCTAPRDVCGRSS